MPSAKGLLCVVVTQSPVACGGTEGRSQCDVSHLDPQTCCVGSSVGRRFTRRSCHARFSRALGQLSGFRLSTGTSGLEQSRPAAVPRLLPEASSIPSIHSSLLL
jgi:hypothetical protein